jgi:hypothetical protein
VSQPQHPASGIGPAVEREAVRGAPTPTHWLVLDAEAMTHVDSAGLAAIAELMDETRPRAHHARGGADEVRGERALRAVLLGLHAGQLNRRRSTRGSERTSPGIPEVDSVGRR